MVKVKLSNIELLKVVAMLMIVCHLTIQWCRTES